MSYEPDSPEELIRDEEEQILERAEEGKASNEVAQKGQIDSETKQDAGEGKKGPSRKRSCSKSNEK